MAEQPQIRVAEALVKPLESHAIIRRASTTIAERRKTAEELVALGGSVDAKTGIKRIQEAMAGRKPFSTREAEEAKNTFGLGDAKDEHGNPRTDWTGKEDAKELREAGIKAIDTIQNVVTYSQIQDEAVRTGKKPDDIRKARGLKEDFNTIRKKALESLLKDEVIVEIFKDPDFAGLPVAAKQDLLDQALAVQPDFRDKVIKGYQSAAEKLRDLPEVQRDPETVQAESVRTSKEKESNEALVRVENYFIDKGTALNDPMKKMIADALKNGRSTEYVMERIQRELIGKLKQEDVAKFNNKLSLENEIVKKRDEVKKMTAKSANPAEIDRINKEIDEGTKSLKTINEELAVDPLLTAKYGEYIRVLQTTHFSESNVVVIELNLAATTHKEMLDAEKIIRDRKSIEDKIQSRSRAERARKESEILNELEGVLGNAAADTIVDRVDELFPLAEKKFTKDQEKIKSDDETLIGQCIKNRWIKYNESTRRKEVDRGQIRDDMLLVTYHGEDGVKRLLAHELGLIPGNVNKATFDLNSLNDQQKARLDAVYASQGNSYRDKLLTDYFLARDRSLLLRRGVDTIGSVGDLKLRNHEWELLQRNFGDKIDSALKSSKEAGSILKGLEDKGVKPHFKFKYLLYILLALGIGAVALTAAAKI